MSRLIAHVFLMLLAVNAVIFLGTYIIDRPFIYNFFLNVALPVVAALAGDEAERHREPRPL
ncbi:MAG: hypothetical protein J5967_07435 [Oscillospiraceae bacterium]|nr:hypothetical protein [Oscillospiraceae bacterium]